MKPLEYALFSDNDKRYQDTPVTSTQAPPEPAHAEWESQRTNANVGDSHTTIATTHQQGRGIGNHSAPRDYDPDRDTGPAGLGSSVKGGLGTADSRGGMGWDGDIETPGGAGLESSVTTTPMFSSSNNNNNDDDNDNDDNDIQGTSAIAAKYQTSFVSAGTTHSAVSDQAGGESLRGGLGAKLLAKAGWKEGEGLGKDGKGRTEPVQAGDKQTRHGLGFVDDTPAPVEFKTHTVDLTKEVEISEYIEFIESPGPYEPDCWKYTTLKEGNNAKDYDLDMYGSKVIVQKIFDLKNKFNDVPRNLFLSARYNSNPYEVIRRHIFQNRAAMKMANMDSIFHLTTPPEGSAEKDFLYFADICAGPGGFTEYVYWRRKTEGAKGYGFTLIGENDWRLDKFHPQAPHDNFEPCYGADNTGDIFKTENIKHFSEVVDKGTNGIGVGMVMADGGFSVEEDHNMQEVLTKQLVLCQFLTMFNILQKNGNFVCKLFDTFTPFTAGLLYILYRNFDRICIMKPVTSRPANSERYVVCLGLKERKPKACDVLFKVNDTINLKDPERDIIEIVSQSMMDGQFTDYLRRMNAKFGEQQIEALSELIKYIEDPGLVSRDQNSIARRCIERWDLPPMREKAAVASVQHTESRAWDAMRYETQQRYAALREKQRQKEMYGNFKGKKEQREEQMNRHRGTLSTAPGVGTHTGGTDPTGPRGVVGSGAFRTGPSAARSRTAAPLAGAPAARATNPRSTVTTSSLAAKMRRSAAAPRNVVPPPLKSGAGSTDPAPGMGAAGSRNTSASAAHSSQLKRPGVARRAPNTTGVRAAAGSATAAGKRKLNPAASSAPALKKAKQGSSLSIGGDALKAALARQKAKLNKR